MHARQVIYLSLQDNMVIYSSPLIRLIFIPLIPNKNTGSFFNATSRDLIGLAPMVYEPLYHAREMATIKLSSGCFAKRNQPDLAISFNCC